MSPSRNPTPEAFYQGELDRLCGVYSVINTVQALLAHHRRLDSKEARSLFNALIEQLTPVGLHNAIKHGMPVSTVGRLLRVAGGWLVQRRKLGLLVSRPLQKIGRGEGPDSFMRLAAAELPRGCILARLVADQLNHWTTIYSFDERVLKLLDSDGLGVLRRRSVRLLHSGPKRKVPSEFGLILDECFLIRLSETR